MVKNLPAMWETRVQSLGWKDPLEEVISTHSSILSWRIPKQRSLVGNSPQGRKELGTTKRIILFAFTNSCSCMILSTTQFCYPQSLCGELIYFHGFKYHLTANCSQIYASSPDLSPGHQTHTSNSHLTCPCMC